MPICPSTHSDAASHRQRVFGPKEAANQSKLGLGVSRSMVIVSAQVFNEKWPRIHKIDTSKL